MSWCRRSRIDCWYDREIILEFEEMLIGVGECMIQRIQEAGIMRTK